MFTTILLILQTKIMAKEQTSRFPNVLLKVVLNGNNVVEIITLVKPYITYYAVWYVIWYNYGKYSSDKHRF